MKEASVCAEACCIGYELCSRLLFPHNSRPHCFDVKHHHIALWREN